MLRLVLSKTGQEAEGDWRPGKQSYLSSAQESQELQRQRGNRRTVFLQMWLSCVRAPPRVSPDLGIWGCGFTVSDTG